MNHSPYLDWLFEERGELSTDQAKALSAHLAECGECRRQGEALRQMERVLQNPVMASPAAGFAQRFQARLQEQRRLAHRTQTRLVLGLGLSALVTILGMLALLAWPYIGSLELALWAFAYQLMSYFYFLDGLGEFLAVLLAATASVIPLFGWLLAIGLAVELGVLWVVSYRLLTNPRRLENS
jgi:hypothetical protein